MEEEELGVFEQLVDTLERQNKNLKKALSGVISDYEEIKSGTLTITKAGYQFEIDRLKSLL